MMAPIFGLWGGGKWWFRVPWFRAPAQALVWRQVRVTAELHALRRELRSCDAPPWGDLCAGKKNQFRLLSLYRARRGSTQRHRAPRTAMTAPKSHHGVTASAHTPWLTGLAQAHGRAMACGRASFAVREMITILPSPVFCFVPDRFWICDCLVCSVFPFFMSAGSSHRPKSPPDDATAPLEESMLVPLRRHQLVILILRLALLAESLNRQQV
ncbi:hypothetical protein EDB80DRAFT_103557 [Ilyonectria destructans]|nr:hypothetical protein EDB80DRAFT_103557 [Ilyonectria destructans]